jgi:ubiquinone/menaquinone biosynthesis C-methylase UbiE
VTFVLDIEGAHISSLRRLGDVRGRHVLEIGCGDGRLTKDLAAEAASLLAFDPNPAFVELALRRLEAEVRGGAVRIAVGSADAIELPRAAFEVAVFSWSY